MARSFLSRSDELWLFNNFCSKSNEDLALQLNEKVSKENEEQIKRLTEILKDVSQKSVIRSIQSEIEWRKSPNGMTALYPAAEKALDLLKDEDSSKYNVSAILMTDGNANIGTFANLRTKYNTLKKDIPIYSITFGSANEYQLREIANLTNAKVFDGKNNFLVHLKIF